MINPRTSVGLGIGLHPVAAIRDWRAEDLLTALIVCRHSHPFNANLIEFDLQNDGTRKIDLFTVYAGQWAGTRAGRIAYEIKVSRSDFARELRTPEKYVEAMRCADRFYYVAPAGILPIEDIPARAGLIEVAQDARTRWAHRWRCKVVLKAPRLPAPLETAEIVAALVRPLIMGRPVGGTDPLLWRWTNADEIMDKRGSSLEDIWRAQINRAVHFGEKDG